MANSITVPEQLVLAGNFIRTKPIRVLVILFLVAAAPIVARKYEPIIVKYSARLTDPEREIETLLIVNPNADKRDVFLDLSPHGETVDFGVDESVAIDLSNKPTRSIRLTVPEQGVSTITVLRSQLDHLPVKAPPKSVEFVPTDSVMRRVAITFLISLMLFIKEALGAIGALVGAISGAAVVFNPRELKEKIVKVFA
jgi:hypothetical protein